MGQLRGFGRVSPALLRRQLLSGPKKLVRALLRRSVRHEGRLPDAVAYLVESTAAQRIVPPSAFLRQMYEETRPLQPIQGLEPYPSIDVVIPCTGKDLPTVGLSLQGCREACLNPIERITLVSPERDVAALARMLGGEVQVLADEDLGLPKTFAAIERLVPVGRRGWVVQQVAKLAMSARSTQAGVLVVDADTILMAPRLWLTGTQQLLPVTHDFHLPYVQQAMRCLGELGRSERSSYVAHHQLMQPRVVRRMLAEMLARTTDASIPGEVVDVDTALACWVEAADFRNSSALCEYHTYGAYLRNTEPTNAALARWANVGVSRSLLSANELVDVSAIRRRFPTAMSVSLHAYLD